MSASPLTLIKFIINERESLCSRSRSMTMSNGSNSAPNESELSAVSFSTGLNYSMSRVFEKGLCETFMSSSLNEFDQFNFVTVRACNFPFYTHTRICLYCWLISLLCAFTLKSINSVGSLLPKNERWTTSVANQTNIEHAIKGQRLHVRWQCHSRVFKTTRAKLVPILKWSSLSVMKLVRKFSYSVRPIAYYG